MFTIHIMLSALLASIAYGLLPNCLPLTGAQSNSCARLKQILQQYPDQCSISSWLKPHCSVCGECSAYRQLDTFSSETFQPGEKVYNGIRVTASDYSRNYGFMVQPSFGSRSHCTATLIARRWILSAAHCFPSRTPSVIRIGSPTNGQGTSYTVRRRINHPDYQPWNPSPFRPEYADIALIETTRDVTGPILSVLNVNYFNSVTVEGNNAATMIGWGQTVSGGSGSNTLMRGTTAIRNSCDYGDGRTGSYICFRSSSSGVCNGDSGGPLMVSDSSGNFVQIGVLSGSSCESGSGYYQDLRRFGDWIRQTIGGAAGPTPNYYMRSAGRNSCPSGYRVMTEQECRDMTNAGFAGTTRWGGVEDPPSSRYPTGCFYWQERDNIWFNTHSGQGEAQSRPICIQR